MNICHQCQAENEAIARFCANCGATLQPAPPQHQAPPTTATSQAAFQAPKYPPPPPPPGSDPQSPPPPQNIPPVQPQAPQSQWHPQQTYPPPPPHHPTPKKPPKKKMNGFVLAIIILLPLIIIGLILFFFLSQRNVALNKIGQAQTLTSSYGFAESTLEQERMNAVLTLSSQVQATNTPAPLPENTPTLENTPEVPTIDHEATAKVEQELLLQAMVTATAGFEQTQQAVLAQEEANRIYIENLIPEDERFRLETAKKLTNVPERIEETYTYKSEPEGILLVNNIKNFMVTVTFINHETRNPNETWDIGFWYRIQSGGNGFRTFVTVPNYYEAAYLLGTGHDWITVKGWEQTIPAVDKRAEGKNNLVIVAVEEVGKLYINGEFIASFHIGSTKTSGGLYVWKDYRSSAYTGDTMIFEDIHVWDLD